jgi:fructosamine-3-kinase
MTLQPAICTALESHLSARVAQVEALTGGDINQAYCVTLSNAERVFVKTHPAAPLHLFTREAEGLQWLAEARALRTPQIVLVGEQAPRFLALEYLAPAKPARDFDTALGQGLAALHRMPTPGYGWSADNFIGPLPQVNTEAPDWETFLREQRLLPQLRRAIDSKRGPKRWLARFERLFANLGAILPDEPPQRLHGDLWSGNVTPGPHGEPCLIDPAVYAGHREVDLAMMHLFGGFSERTFQAYEAAFALSPGAPTRRALYQLYPLLVHVNLFGGSYVQSVDAALAGLP